MIVLGVDTATKAASAAIVENGELRCEFLVHHRTMHSRNLMPLVDEAVKSAGISKADIDVFAVTVGPGSFTGVRIGVSTVKAMAYTLGKPAVGVNTLDCLAYDAITNTGGLVCPVLDARNNQVYCALYENKKDITLKRLTDYMAVDIDELMALLAERKQKALFTGDAAAICASWDEPYGILKEAVHPGRGIPRASALAFMAQEAEKTDPALLLPFYLRKSGAERMLQQRKNEGTV